MATIEELERRINQLEKDLQEEKELTSATLSKANKAADYAQHAYRVDHYGIIWVWNTEQQKYCKTEMRVISPKVANRSIESRQIADNAIEGRHLVDNVIEGRMIKSKTIDGRSLKNDIIGPELIEDNSINGDSYQAGALIPGKLADDAVQTRNIKDRNVTASKIAKKNIYPEHLDDSFIPVFIRPITDDLQNQIDSIEASGVALSNKFGDDRHIGISQLTLTDAWNNIYHLLEEALGRSLLGFTWNVTPTYIYGEWPTTIHVTALPTNPEDLFEYIKLSVNGEIVDEVVTKVPSYSFNINLQESANIRLDAQVLGKPYYRTTEIRHYDSFWLGGGATYDDVMIEADNINFSEGTRLAKDVAVADGEHIIIVMGDSWVPAFIRADMNGVEIEFDEATVTIDGKNYKVLTSKSVFEAGTYNIDING